MKKLFQILSISLMTIFIMTSCAKAPVEKVSEVNQAIELAKSAQSDIYLPLEFNALNDSLNSATLLIEEQNSKFFILRNYKDVENLLSSTLILATDILAKTEVRKEEVKNEALSLIEQTSVLINDVKLLIEKAPKGKEGKAALSQMSTELSLVEPILVESTELIKNGEYLTALDKVKAANGTVSNLKAELEKVINKVK